MRAAIALLALALVLSGARAQVFPDPDWTVQNPALHGMDAARLQLAADYADQENSDCFVVARNGFIVGEYYFDGATPDTRVLTYSASKSVTSTLIGIAQDRGLLNINQLASVFIPEWAQATDGRQNITIRNLISNDSGRGWTFLSDYITPILVPDQTQYAIGLQQDHPPGTFWEYNNMAIQTLARILERATGLPLAEFARQTLFDPLNIELDWDTDPAGNTLAYSGVNASCRDLAKFAYLWSQGGRWSLGRQIVSQAYVAEATGVSSTPLNSAYGYMFWLNRDGHWVGPSVPGPDFDIENPIKPEGDGQFLGPDVPESAFCAVGLGDQIACYDPTTNVIIARATEREQDFEQGAMIADLYALVAAAIIA